MEKKKKRIAWIACLSVGFVEGVGIFIALSYEWGFIWYVLLLCLVGGAFVGSMNYFAWLRLTKGSQAYSFDNRIAQKRLLAYERNNVANFEEKYYAFFEKGKGLKYCVCEACLYIQAKKILITVWYFWKIYTIEIPYEDISVAIVYDDKVLNFETLQTDEVIEIILKESTPKFKKVLRGKGVYIYLESSDAAQGSGTYDEDL